MQARPGFLIDLGLQAGIEQLTEDRSCPESTPSLSEETYTITMIIPLHLQSPQSLNQKTHQKSTIPLLP